jgi:cell division protease FtsH
MMVTEFGMSDLGPIQYEQAGGSVFLGRDYTNTQKNFSTQIAFEIDKAVRQISDEAHERAKNLLLEKKDQVILIAETLLENETITAEEIEGLIGKKEEPAEEKAEKPAPKKAPAKKAAPKKAPAKKPAKKAEEK